MAKKGLGRGIESLFTENSLEEINSSSTEKVKLVDIVPNKDQPRKNSMMNLFQSLQTVFYNMVLFNLFSFVPFQAVHISL